MNVTCNISTHAFDDLAEAWNDLMGRAVSAPIFMTVEYQKIWWQHFGNDNLRLITVRADDGTLMGIAPLFVDGDTLHFVGCVDVSDYLDFLIDRDHITETYAAIVDYLATNLADEWRTAYFCSLACHSITPRILAELIPTRGWTTATAVEEVCPVIILSGSWDEYLAGIAKKQRHEIRRKLRRAEATADVRWRVLQLPEDVTDAEIDTFISLHRKSAAEKDQFWDDKKLTFFRAIIKKFAEMGWLKFYFLDINQVSAAALLCFDYRNEILVYNSGYDVENFGHLSPGIVIISYSIRHAIELNRSRYDFLRGDEAYKFRFGAVAEDVFGVSITKGDA